MSPSLRYYLDLQVWKAMRAVYEAFGRKVPPPKPEDYRCETCGAMGECKHYPEYP